MKKLPVIQLATACCQITLGAYSVIFSKIKDKEQREFIYGKQKKKSGVEAYLKKK